MATSSSTSIKTLRNFRNWITEQSAPLTNKMERWMIACHHGYNKIQPVRLSKGAVTMMTVQRNTDAKSTPNAAPSLDGDEGAAQGISLCREPNSRCRGPPQLSVMNKC